MANVEQTNGALDVSQAINKQIATKIKYLQELETAVDHHDDCKVYQLWTINAMLLKSSIASSSRMNRA